ncbi:CheR family methyltransferase [Sphingobium subterraneum]|uniref:protein-glutamate O-methyltransferase n=1 Tax=Sphingobium subterraneum TaxID=627688 RepID=A0A841IYF9_9SPHN|nr:protein-glutamate O-methyltransferase CheR [Sphingobium subterraneum]MBB6122316.1 chemotaxis protein methyltransferase CheR [Sphingobium subterraneum]
MTGSRQSGAIRMIAALLEARTGQVLSENRMWRLETSLKPLMRANSLRSLEDLVARLADQGGGPLANDVVNALLNNESSFFRDHHVFQMLATQILPHIAQTRKEKSLRIWSAGCSTGQEAYSLAMTLRKQADLWKGWQISILATDISSSVVERAQAGLFSQIDVQRGLAVNDLLRWFEPAGDTWRISQELRHMIDFRVDNLFEPQAPSGSYDLVMCRNVQFYFSAEMRRKVFGCLARHSAPGGYLILGAGETVIGQTIDFTASMQFRGIYERVRPKEDASSVKAA